MVWLAENALIGFESEAQVMALVYEDINRSLLDLDPSSVTEGQLRNSLFDVLLASPNIEREYLNETANSLAVAVASECGTIPILAFVIDLFATTQSENNNDRLLSDLAPGDFNDAQRDNTSIQ